MSEERVTLGNLPLRFEGTHLGEKPVIGLEGSRRPALLIPGPSGVIYTAQSGGYACLHPYVEGVLIPLEHAKGYPGDPDCIGCWGDWSEYDVATLQQWLDDNNLPMEVIRDSLKKSAEGWAWVRIKPDISHESFSAFAGEDVILVWENCD